MEIQYKTFSIPKRSGGMRKIEQPINGGMKILRDKLIELESMPELKPSYFAHAFLPGRNIVTCARAHFGKKYIVRVDIKDFFTSITLTKFKEEIENRLRRKHQFRKDPKDEVDKIIDVVSICFKRAENKVEGKYEYYLPQGSPCSPFLSNAYMRSFDWSVAWYCYKNGITYSRYADDMYFSSNTNDKVLWSCVKMASQALNQHKLKENMKKRRLMKQGVRMNVVGIVCNEKFQVNREVRKRIRAIKHNCKVNKRQLTLEEKGLINFADMVKNYDSKVSTSIEVCRGIELIKAI